MRQGMTFRLIPLNDQPRLAGWILAVGVFLFSVGSEGGEVVAQAFGYLDGFAFGSVCVGHGWEANIYKGGSITILRFREEEAPRMTFSARLEEFHTGNTAGIVSARCGIRAGASVAA